MTFEAKLANFKILLEKEIYQHKKISNRLYLLYISIKK